MIWMHIAAGTLPYLPVMEVPTCKTAEDTLKWESRAIHEYPEGFYRRLTAWEKSPEYSHYIGKANVAYVYVSPENGLQRTYCTIEKLKKGGKSHA